MSAMPDTGPARSQPPALADGATGHTHHCGLRYLGCTGHTMSSRLSIERAAVSEFSERHHIARLAPFSSVIRDDSRPENDIDVLAEFQPGIRVGLAFIRMQDELSAVLGRLRPRQPFS
jgi:predicted nucleotidyltransferase